VPIHAVGPGVGRETRVQNLETRDGILSSGMDVGVNEGFDKLDELLAKGP